MANCVQCGRRLPPFSFRKICQWCVQHEAAQRGEEAEDVRQPVMRTPWVRRGESSITLTQVLFGANVAVFLAMAFASSSIESFQGPTLVQFGGNYGPATLSGQWWRLVTYMFLHGGLMHIGFNMWCLWDLGALCESLYGRWTFAAVYFITGLAGGIVSVGWNPGVLSVGASGAIFGLAGALIASFYLGEFSFGGLAIKGVLRSLLFFAGFNIVFGFLVPGVDNGCHFGGLISGLILGALIAKLAPHVENPGPRAAVLGFVAVIVVAAGLAVQHWRGAPYRMERALLSQSETNPENVTAQLQALVRKQPNFAQAHFALAQAYFGQQNFPEAETEFKKVLELEPDNTSARLNLGIVYLNQKQFDDASAAFGQVLAKDPNDAEAHYGMGTALGAQQKSQEAIEQFKTAIRLNPQMPGVNYELGRVYDDLKMYDDAIRAYLGEREKSGDTAELEDALAGAYQAKGMTEPAEEARAKAAHLKGVKQP
jgi:rhomboid protease GluP